MKRSTLLRVAALFLCAIALSLSLVGCAASRPLHASPRAKKVVAKAGNVDILYDELYYLANTRIAELKEAYGDDVLDDPEVLEELERFVWEENLLTREHALISLGLDYGLEIGKGELKDSVAENMQAFIENNFGGSRRDYADGLNEGYLTDRYVRMYVAVSDYLPTAIVKAMIEEGDIPTDDETAWKNLQGEDFIRTVQVFVDKNNGRSDEQNRAYVYAAAERLAAIEDDEERYLAMREEIKGAYNNDYHDTLGNGYYFAKGEYDSAYEKVAFDLDEYESSDVLETEDGYYIIMCMPKDEEYMKENFEEFKNQSYFVELNNAVDERLEEMTLEKTSFGESLDLTDLPRINARGGDILITVLVIVGVVAVLVIAYFVVRAFLKRKSGESGKGGAKKDKVKGKNAPKTKHAPKGKKQSKK